MATHFCDSLHGTKLNTGASFAYRRDLGSRGTADQRSPTFSFFLSLFCFTIPPTSRIPWRYFFACCSL